MGTRKRKEAQHNEEQASHPQLMKTKPVWQSKTFWLNVVVLVAALCPPAAQWIACNPETAAAAVTAANVLVRFATSGKISLFSAGGETGGDDQNPKSSGPPGGVSLRLLMVGCMVGALAFPSCSPTGIQARVTAPDGTEVGYSSKGGLVVEFERGAPHRSVVAEK